MKGKGKGKAIIHIAMAAIILASVLAGTTVVLGWGVHPGLTAELSTTEVDPGDTFTVSGNAIDLEIEQVDIITIAPCCGRRIGMNGSAGTYINVRVPATIPGITYVAASVSGDDTFSKEIHVHADAEPGTYYVMVFSPGRDGYYGSGDIPNGNMLLPAISRGNAADLLYKTRAQLLAIIEDATTGAAGSDDLVVALQIKVKGTPCVSLDPISAMEVGDPLRVTGSTCRGDTPISITVWGPDYTSEVVQPQDGKFEATFDTEGIVEGTYEVRAADIDEGYCDVTYVNVGILTPSPTAAPTAKPTPAPTPTAAPTAPTPESVFKITNLIVTPSEVEVGNTVTIIADVMNAGNGAGTYTLKIRVNNAVIHSESLTLSPEEIMSVKCYYTPQTEGDYEVEAGGLRRDFKASSLEMIPTPTGEPELSLSQSSLKEEPKVGEEILITAAILNKGKATAKNIHIEEQIPSSIAISYVEGADKAGGLIYWNGELNPGEAHSITHTLRILEEKSRTIPVIVTYEDAFGKKKQLSTEIYLTAEIEEEVTPTPSPLANLPWVYIIVLVAVVLGGIAIIVAVRRRGGEGGAEVTIEESK